jgi:prepilin-type N-terminal cleavage/methylation domain-containing protein
MSDRATTLRARRRRRLARGRRGFTLIETIVAMTLFGTAALSMASLAAVVAKRGKAADIVSKRESVMNQQVNKFMTTPWDTLTLARYVSTSGDSTRVTTGLLQYHRIVKVEYVDGQKKIGKVTIRVRPVDTRAGEQSAIFTRMKDVRPSPLCVGC